MTLVAAWPMAAGAKAGGQRSTSTQTGLSITGAGYGHGIGMSQYGALGFALHGWSAAQILAHYYEDTTLGTVSEKQVVTVLVADGRPTLNGARDANGKPLDPSTTYAVVPAGADLALVAGRHTVATFSPPLTVSGAGPVELVRRGLFRGSLSFRPDGKGKVQTVDQLDLEDYVRGVIAREMPASWPAAALEAQAIAARSYVLSAGAVGVDFQVYDDTRSQVYGGVAAETPQTDAAVRATAGRVVEYGGVPATTYFFSSSGGYTEDIQNVWIGDAPEAWLQGVRDPYDDAGGNPNYRWHVSMSLRAAAAKLRKLLTGRLLGIQVLRRGVSPRVVSAAIVGSGGRTVVSGVRLARLLGLKSTYMSFKTITPGRRSTTRPVAPPSGGTAVG